MTTPTRTTPVKHSITIEAPSPVSPRIYGDRRELYPADLLAARREALLKAYRSLTPEAQQSVREELAALSMKEDGSDTDMNTQLNDAGYGSQGPV